MGTELDFQRHFENSLKEIHGYKKYTNQVISDSDYYFIESDLLEFIKHTQVETYKKLEEDYGTDTSREILQALREELIHRPLWMIIRNGIQVRGQHFQLYYPKPRSSESIANQHYEVNKISFVPQLEIAEEKKPDIVIFLNGLPIIVIELKHEKNQNVHDAVAQFNKRNHDDKIFQLPFLYVAADTSEVKVATDPRFEENFRWYNSDLENQPINEGEYPIEYLYRKVFSKDSIIEAISFFLVYVPKQERTTEKPERSGFSIFPRYHQSRMVKKVSEDIVEYYLLKGNPGKKYLINHSAGSGKTLSISWLADRLNSLYKPGTSEKIIDIVFVLTDRKALDKNIKDELINFTHLKYKIKFAKKSSVLAKYIRRKEQIIVTTQQKFSRITKILEETPALKDLQVAFLIDEAHRSQEGKMGQAIRIPFRGSDEPDIIESEIDSEESFTNAIKLHDKNQMFVAFTATPAKSTLQLFGEPFDTYTEAEAISEGYIVDVASSITSYSTLYHLQSTIIKPEDEKLFPSGIVAKALKNIAYQDKGLIQYKAELMLRIFEEEVKDLIDGKAKAMIVASSRLSGLYYYEILREKIKEKRESYPGQYQYDILYAFSEFVHPETGREIDEKQVNGLKENELIEDLFDTDKYRIMIVANKFQTGFDQPLLAGMFLDKPVSDRNAVQTVSRLNRSHDNKDRVIVVDFTNNADAIISAFKKYRGGTPFEPLQPDPNFCMKLYEQIINQCIFKQEDADEIVEMITNENDMILMSKVNALRVKFKKKIPHIEKQREFVNKINKFINIYTFLSHFYKFEEKMHRFAIFANFITNQLIKHGSESELKKLLEHVVLTRASVKFEGVKKINITDEARRKRRNYNTLSSGIIKKVSVFDTLEKLKEQYEITEEEAIIIRKVCMEKIQDEEIRSTILQNRKDENYLFQHYKGEIRRSIESSYTDKSYYECLIDGKYIDPGSIFDTMAYTIIQETLSNHV